MMAGIEKTKHLRLVIHSRKSLNQSLKKKEFKNSAKILTDNIEKFIRRKNTMNRVFLLRFVVTNFF
ncbi:hypothetical protein SAMN04488057_105398 [Cyclobacterium lianum]|uniref:Uncharacterized protein n=1 Tax=Cyclobacterium lianum TaxID=388280 RepID=A0A1M7NKF1_9BACT|nr:hypothetical protein SAMN04488057_105398 [Cyclobacterium lianum]